ncbi:MAG TPA: DMT family transporter [Thermoleophilaceae bacterium]|jgi:drug/metabolite transporter (DMT)-like permease
MFKRQFGPGLLLVLAAASWGTSTVTSKYALGDLTPTDLLGMEVAVATVLLVAIAGFNGSLRRTPHWRAYAVLAFFEPGLTFALFNMGLAHTSATDAALLVSLESVFAVALAVAVLHERPGGLFFLAAAVAFGGAALVSLESDSTSSSLDGDLLVLASAAAAAVYVVLARRVAGREAALTVTAYQFMFAMVFALPVVLAGHSNLDHAGAARLAAGVATGVLGSAVPFLLYNLAVRSTTASRAAIALNLVPVFGVLAALVLLGERPGWPQLVGGVLIVAALGLVSAGRGQPEPTPSAPVAAMSLEECPTITA